MTIEERAAQGFTHRIDFSTADIPAGIAVNTSQVFSTAPLPALAASDIIKRIYLHVSTPFAVSTDAAFNSTTLSLGDAGSATRFASAVQINANGTPTINTFPGASENFIYTAAGQLQITLNSMAAKSLSNLNVGKLYILLNVERGADKSSESGVPYGTGYT
jgi:hypothetical protein